jgi:hypothetical protein
MHAEAIEAREERAAEIRSHLVENLRKPPQQLHPASLFPPPTMQRQLYLIHSHRRLPVQAFSRYEDRILYTTDQAEAGCALPGTLGSRPRNRWHELLQHLRGLWPDIAAGAPLLIHDQIGFDHGYLLSPVERLRRRPQMGGRYFLQSV